MIKIENLKFNYKGSKHTVLNGITLSLQENCICGLLGKNGVGKSTLLYLISGLLHPTEGTVEVNGHDSRLREPAMLNDVFLVMEEFDMPGISLKEYVKINAPFYPSFSQEVLEQCLADFDMPQDIADLKQLSMGQKKKVYMSFALATGTRILLMDEPTNGLDIPSKAQFRRVMSRYMDTDRIVIISTHQVHDVDQLLDHVVIMSNEGILLNESTEQIVERYVFEYRTPDDMADALYAEPTLQGNAVIAPRNGKPETQLNLELLFNMINKG